MNVKYHGGPAHGQTLTYEGGARQVGWPEMWHDGYGNRRITVHRYNLRTPPDAVEGEPITHLNADYFGSEVR